MFRDIINLEKAEGQQKNISDAINELEKKIKEKRPGRPLEDVNKKNVENLIENAKRNI